VVVIRRLISRGESSTPPALPARQQVPLPPLLAHPHPPYRPSYLCLPTLALFLFPTSSLCHSCNIDSHSFAHSPSPSDHSFNRPTSTAFARIDWNPDLTKNRSDISADQDRQPSAVQEPPPTPTPTPQTPNTYLKAPDPRGLKTNSLPRHSPEVATTSTKYLGEAQTNERWMTKRRRDCSLPLPSMTLSNRLHIQSSVH